MLLGLPDAVDFGHGTLDLVDTSVSGRGEDSVPVYKHYAFRNGAYAEAQPLDFYEIFYRANGAPKTEVVEFDIPARLLGKPFHLIVGNGGQSSSRLRVAAGTISINGSVVSPASDFSESRGSWTVPLALQAHNTLAVRLEGKPKSRVAIAIIHD